ncbi:MAG: WhiB family transcriptional regulator [Pseudonocardiaceae bacterium]
MYRTPRTYDPLPRDHQHQRQEHLRRTEAARICATCPVRARCSKVTT